MASALGPAGPPARKAVLLVPPPMVGGGGAVVDTSRTVIDMIVCPWIAVASTELGLFTIACVIPTICAGGDRNALGRARFCCSNGTIGPCTGMGSMLTGWNTGPPCTAGEMPCARMVVPWGIDAIRTTVGGSAGLVVCGTVAQIPGSM